MSQVIRIRPILWPTLALTLLGALLGSVTLARAGSNHPVNHFNPNTGLMGDANTGYEQVQSLGNQIELVNSVLSPSAAPPLTCGSKVRIMPLGDSITQGYASGTPNFPDTAYMISYRKDVWDYFGPNSIDLVGSLTGDGSAYPGFDTDHEGHGGKNAEYIRDNIYGSGENWLNNHPADIILLHIGTNNIANSLTASQIAAVVGQILDRVNQYEIDKDKTVTVLVAQIINRNCDAVPADTACPGQRDKTTLFNQELANVVNARIASGDSLYLVNMETGAGINYSSVPIGDMWDKLHPFATGYSKIAFVWEQILKDLIPFCAYDDSPSVAEDSGDNTLSVLGNDGGRSLTITAVGTAQNGLATMAPDNQSLIYHPKPDFFGSDTFTYTINNGPSGATNDTQASVTVTVTPVNDAPTAIPDSKSTLEDTPLVIPGSDLVSNDLKGPSNETSQILSVKEVSSTAATHGSVTLNNGTITYTPAKDYNGPASFGYTVCDNATDSLCDSKGVVNLTITPVNDVPSFVVSDLNIYEDIGPQSTVGWVSGVSAGPADEAGQLLTFTITSNSSPALFSALPAISSNTKTLTYTTADNAFGEALITVVLNDDGGAGNGGKDTSSPQSFKIIVDPVADPPILSQPNDNEYAVGENVWIQVSASDPDGTQLTFSASGLPGGLIIGTGTGLIQGKLPPGSAGIYNVQVNVTNTNNLSAKSSFKITVYTRLVRVFLPFALDR